MTHTDSTAAGLLRGVLLNPENDTARLVYADRLEEIAGTVPCPTCKGGGKEPAPPLINATDGKTYRYIEPLGPCPTCKGGGTVSDGLAERAELIRVQCELARTPDPGCLHCWEGNGCVYHALQRREHPLLTAERRREWARVPCQCPGGAPRGEYPGGPKWKCSLCNGTGDRMNREGAIFDGSGWEGCTPHFERGFVARVEVPALSWVIERCEAACPGCSGTGRVPKQRGRGGWTNGGGTYRCEACSGSGYAPPWRVTDWALAIARAHPVTRWEVGDREPYWDAGVWQFFGTDDPAYLTDEEPLNVPVVLHDAWRVRVTKAAQSRGEDGRIASRDALALALGEVVRAAATEEVRT